MALLNVKYRQNLNMRIFQKEDIWAGPTFATLQQTSLLKIYLIYKTTYRGKHKTKIK